MIDAMTPDDYPAVMDLWMRTEGVGLSESDSEEAIGSYLRRNPGMSAVVKSPSGEVVGAVLCGHDGRRGYLHHLAVAPRWRNRGIAAALIARSLKCLAHEGIRKCSVFVLGGNAGGASFWKHNGWPLRADLQILQKPVDSPAGPEI